MLKSVCFYHFFLLCFRLLWFGKNHFFAKKRQKLLKKTKNIKKRQKTAFLLNF